MKIAETARVDRRAELADGVEVGPYCVVGPDVTIGRGTRLISHVHLSGTTALGADNVLGPFVAIGGDPQDHSYLGGETRVEVGDRNTLGERVTIHRGTEQGGGVTQVGSDNRVMSGAHLAHDCRLADRVTVGALSMLAGHVHVEAGAEIRNVVAVLQFVTVGRDCLIGTHAKVSQDAPRFMVIEGNPAAVRCVNVSGLKGAGMCREAVHALREAYRLLYRARTSLRKATEVLGARGLLTAEVLSLLEFVGAQRDGRQGRARGRANLPGRDGGEPE